MIQRHFFHNSHLCIFILNLQVIISFSRWEKKKEALDSCTGFPRGSVVKNPPASAGDAGDVGLIPGSGRSPGGGHGNPSQYSCLQNSMNRGAWQAMVHGVAKSQSWLKRLSTNTRTHRPNPMLLNMDWVFSISNNVARSNFIIWLYICGIYLCVKFLLNAVIAPIFRF